MTDASTHFRTCPLCESMCGLRIEVERGRVRDIRGDVDDPFSRGHICPKAHALLDIHEDPDRLRTPMRRRNGVLEPCTMAEAIAEVAERLHAIEKTHGRGSLGIYLGNPSVHNLGAMVYGPMLIRALHTKHRFSATSVDQLPHMFAAYLMFGHQLLVPVPDVDRTAYMLVLGANPLASNGSLMSAPGMKKRLTALRERGGKLVVIDPRRTETANAAQRHLFIRPGTDALLLLALVRELFARGPVRLGALASHCRSLDELRAAVAPYAPERVAARVGIDEEMIRTIAKELSDAESSVVYGRVGACTQKFGGITAWLINVLNLITGNFDRPGGVMFTKPAADIIGVANRGVVAKGSFGRFRSRVRGLPEFGGELPVAALADEILEDGPGRIRALVTMAGNPVLSAPNGRRIDEALSELEFMVSIDPYVNETTRHADVILPPTSPLEKVHYDLALHALAVRNTAKLSLPVLPRATGALDDGEIASRIVEALETARHGAWSRPALTAKALRLAGAERMLDAMLRLGPYRGRRGPSGRGLTLARLRREPHGVDLGPLEPCMPERLPAGHRFIDLAPRQILADLERLEGSLVEPSPALVLVGRRHVRSNNSWLHNAPSLMRGADRCTLMVHPSDAGRLGLAAGSDAKVRSRVGEVQVKVEVTEDVMPGVVSLPHGYGHARDGVELRVARESPGVSINDLTDDARLDELTGTAAFNGVPVEVSPA